MARQREGPLRGRRHGGKGLVERQEAPLARRLAKPACPTSDVGAVTAPFRLATGLDPDAPRRVGHHEAADRAHPARPSSGATAATRGATRGCRSGRQGSPLGRPGEPWMGLEGAAPKGDGRLDTRPPRVFHRCRNGPRVPIRRGHLHRRTLAAAAAALAAARPAPGPRGRRGSGPRPRQLGGPKERQLRRGRRPESAWCQPQDEARRLRGAQDRRGRRTSMTHHASITRAQKGKKETAGNAGAVAQAHVGNQVGRSRRSSSGWGPCGAGGWARCRTSMA